MRRRPRFSAAIRRLCLESVIHNDWYYGLPYFLLFCSSAWLQFVRDKRKPNTICLPSAGALTLWKCKTKWNMKCMKRKNMTKDFHHLVWKPFWGREAIKGHCSLVCKAQCLPSLHYVLFFLGLCEAEPKSLSASLAIFIFFRVNPERHELMWSARPTRTHRTNVSLMSAVWITSSSFVTLCMSVISSSSMLNISLFAAAPNQLRLPWISAVQQHDWLTCCSCRKLDCRLTAWNQCLSKFLQIVSPQKCVRSSRHHIYDRRWFICTFFAPLAANVSS